MSSSTASPPEVDWFQIDWDEWRRQHATMSFSDQQAFYRRVAELYPHQQSFDALSCHAAFDAIDRDRLIVSELGGWDGALAAVMLGRPDVLTWTNYDLVEVPQICRHEKYRLEIIDDYLWNRDKQERCDVFVACHTIEHLTAEELTRLFGAVESSYVYLEAPLFVDAWPDWTGYPGSHILELSWREVDEMLNARGYRVVANGLWAR